MERDEGGREDGCLEADGWLPVNADGGGGGDEVDERGDDVRGKVDLGVGVSVVGLKGVLPSPEDVRGNALRAVPGGWSDKEG